MNKKTIFATLVIACVGCKKDSATTTTTTETAETVATTAATTAATTPTATTTTAASATASATGSGSTLPRAKDVLPEGEVSGESLVVTGDGYRYQIPPTLSSTGSGNVYSGKVSGMIADATLTMWVTKEPFGGDVKALAARETKAATTAGGKITESLSPAMMKTAGAMDNTHAQRFVVQLPGRYEMRELTVYKGTAYIFHCQTPDVLNAWINVGSDCMIKGTTFHVAPPPGK